MQIEVIIMKIEVLVIQREEFFIIKNTEKSKSKKKLLFGTFFTTARTITLNTPHP